MAALTAAAEEKMRLQMEKHKKEMEEKKEKKKTKKKTAGGEDGEEGEGKKKKGGKKKAAAAAAAQEDGAGSPPPPVRQPCEPLHPAATTIFQWFANAYTLLDERETGELAADGLGMAAWGRCRKDLPDLVKTGDKAAALEWAVADWERERGRPAAAQPPLRVEDVGHIVARAEKEVEAWLRPDAEERRQRKKDRHADPDGGGDDAPGAGEKKSAAAAAGAKAKVAERLRRTLAEAEEEAAALRSELRAAQETAARLRARDGAGRFSQLQLGPFQLAAPGGGADLLEEAQMVLRPGRRYGLIGRNGCGKSTLMKYVGARRVGGLAKHVSVHYVAQAAQLQPADEELRPLDVVLAADVERRLLLEEQAAGDGDAERLVAVEERLDEIGAATAEQRALAALGGLGFTDTLLARPVRALSGGWRMRTCLAAALFSRPDVLLLDEPTNHLSIEAVLWLARELATSATWAERIIVVVSHDRAFIEETCTDMLHVSAVAHRLTQTRGTYSDWFRRRQELQKAKQKAREVDQAQYDKLQAWVDRPGGGRLNHHKSNTIAMQQKMMKQMAKMEEEFAQEDEQLADLADDTVLPLSLQAGGRLDKFAVQLQRVGFGYPDQPTLFTGAEFTVDSKSRIVLLGENGNGKTTLLKLLAGKLEATSGRVLRDPTVRLSYVNQHHADQLDFEASPLEFMKTQYPGDRSYSHELALRKHLGGCGCVLDLQETAIAKLSGGQRSRVAFACVSYAKPHVLLMDEPTNDLDLETAGALAECVAGFEGGVVIVSHDSHFVGRIAEEVWVVEGGAVTRVESFDVYRQRAISKLAKQA